MSPDVRPILKQIVQLWKQHGWSDYDDTAFKAANLIAQSRLSEKSIATLPENFFTFNRVSRNNLLKALRAVKLPSTSPSANQANILVLLASPEFETRIRVDKEYRAIYQRLAASTNRDLFPLNVLTAVQPGDIIDVINKTKPTILQISSHGNPNGLVLDGDSIYQGALLSSQLEKIIASIDPPLKIVILNSCQSSQQAKSLAKYADIAIGMSANIGDIAAAAFSTQFYASLAEGCSVKTAFDQALISIELSSPNYTDVPQLFTKKNIDASKYYFKR